jgi:hypothetical protein
MRDGHGDGYALADPHAHSDGHRDGYVHWDRHSAVDADQDAESDRNGHGDSDRHRNEHGSSDPDRGEVRRHCGFCELHGLRQRGEGRVREHPVPLGGSDPEHARLSADLALRPIE